MAVTAKFVADFSSFQQAVQDAQVQLKSFEDGAGRVSGSLSRMVDNFSGRKLIQDATLMAEAVERVGGVSTLTESELARVGAQASQAAEKLRAMGQDVPANIQRIADAVHGGAEATGGWIPLLHELGSSWVARIAEGVLLRDAVHEVIDKIKEMIVVLPELALQGSHVADVEKSFERLTEAAGLSGAALTGTLRTATHGTITDFELMKSVNQDLAAGMHLSEGQFKTLADGAFALAKATGGDVKTALDTMNDAMLTGRTRSLALLTGKIDVTAAEEKFAAALGSSKDQLTDTGKLEAMRAAILEAVGSATERLGTQTDSLADRVKQGQVTWANFEEELGKTLASSQVLATGMDGLKVALLEAFGGTQKSAIDAIASAVDTVTIRLIDLGQIGVTSGGFLAKEFIAAEKVFGDVAQVVDGVRLAFMYANLEAAKVASWTDRSQKVKDDIVGIDTAIGDLLVTMKRRGDALQADDIRQKAVDTTTDQYHATLDGLKRSMEAARASSEAFVGPLQDLAEGHKKAGVAAGDHAKLLKDVQEKLFEVTTTVGVLDGAWGRSADEINLAGNHAMGTIPMFAALQKGLEGISTALSDLDFRAFGESTISVWNGIGGSVEKVEGIIGLMPDISDNARQHMEKLGATTEESFGDRVVGAMGSVSKIISGLHNQVAEFANVVIKAGESIIKNLADGNIWGAIVSGATAVVSVISKLWDDPEKKVNPVRQAYIDAAGGLGQLNLEATRAGTNLWALLQAKNMEQYQKAIDDLNKALAAQAAQVAADSSALGELLKSGQALGLQLPAALQESIQKLIDMGKITGDTVGLFQALSASTGVDFKTMSTVAQKYGIDLANLGPAFQSAKLHDAAQTISDDFDTLTRGGADVDAVLAGMKKPINDLVNDSLKAGVAIPSNFKPWVDQLELTGQLTDANGDKITDLSGLKFADPIVTQFQQIVNKLQELIDKISGSSGVTSAIDKIPKDVSVHVGFNVDNPPDFGNPIPMAAGGRGRVTKPTLFLAGEKGPEDVAFSGANRSFGDSGGADNADLLAELRALRRDLPRSMRDAVLLAG